MPAWYKIDRDHRFVMSTGSGTLTKEDMLGHQDRLLKDPEFDPEFSQLLDFTHVSKIEVDERDIRLLARRSVFSPQSRRAVLVTDQRARELLKLFENLRAAVGERNIRSFQTLDDAIEWLALKSTPRARKQ